MINKYASVPSTYSITLPNGNKHNTICSVDDMPKVPVLTNPERLKAKQHLVALDDQVLAAVRLKCKQDAMAVAKA